LTGKILIDATNPVLPDLSGLAPGNTTSAGEQVAGWARGTVKQLAGELGFKGVDAGALTQARVREPFALLWISLAFKAGLGPEFAFKLLRRTPVWLTDLFGHSKGGRSYLCYTVANFVEGGYP